MMTTSSATSGSGSDTPTNLDMRAYQTIQKSQKTDMDMTWQYQHRHHYCSNPIVIVTARSSRRDKTRQNEK